MQTCSKCGMVAPHPAPFCSSCGTSLISGGVMPAIPSMPVAPKTSGLAITGFVLSFVCGVLGLIFSILGYNEAKKSNGRITGQGFALAGIIISIVSTLIALLMWWLVFRVVDSIDKMVDHVVDESGARVTLRRMSERADEYYLEHGRYPAADFEPAAACCAEPNQRCTHDWTLPEWKSLGFEYQGFDHDRFRFGYVSTATSFEAIAVGDVDCDGEAVTLRLRVEPGDDRIRRQPLIRRSGED